MEENLYVILISRLILIVLLYPVFKRNAEDAAFINLLISSTITGFLIPTCIENTNLPNGIKATLVLIMGTIAVCLLGVKSIFSRNGEVFLFMLIPVIASITRRHKMSKRE